MDERFKRNFMLGALSVSGTVAFLTWGTLFSERAGEGEFPVSPETPLSANRAMLDAAATVGQGPRRIAESPLPVDTPNHSLSSPESPIDPAGGRRLAKVELGRAARSAQAWGPGGGAGEGGAAGRFSNSGTAATRAGAVGRWDLGPEDAAALMKAAGPLDQKSAERLGSDPKALSRAMDDLVEHPKALHYLMDNPYVAKKFFENKKIKDACADKRALAHSLSDAADQSGLKGYLKTMARSVGVPGSTIAMVESKINGVLFSSCPSFQQLAGDPSLVSGLINTAPEFFQVMGDPRFATRIGQGLGK